MTLVMEGIALDDPLRPFIENKMTAVTSRGRLRPISARVAFTDENGPKGGPGIRCALTVDMPRRRPLHVEDTAATPRQAFDLAFEALERRALQEIDRARDRRRRPKKYFVAKRLLEAEAERPVETPSRQRRSA